jgi:hypothetical protein
MNKWNTQQTDHGSQCLKVFKQARSRIHSIGYNGKYFQMILRSIIGNEVVFALNHYSDKVCVVFWSGCEPVDILVVCLYRYCRWRSKHDSTSRLDQPQGNISVFQRITIIICM